MSLCHSLFNSLYNFQSLWLISSAWVWLAAAYVAHWGVFIRKILPSYLSSTLTLSAYSLLKTWGLGGVVVRRRRRPWGRACLRCQAARAGAQPAPRGFLAFLWRRCHAHTRSVAMRFLHWWRTSSTILRSMVSDRHTYARTFAQSIPMLNLFIKFQLQIV